MSRRIFASVDGAPSLEFGTITAARRYAEGYGSTARRCEIALANKSLTKFTVIAAHVRDTNGDGLRWFKAEI